MFPRTGKPVKGSLSTSVRGHRLTCDHKVVHEAFEFLGNKSNRYLLEVKEVYSLKEIRHHLIRTYIRRSYYCSQYSI